jgi:hypothetical protein
VPAFTEDAYADCMCRSLFSHRQLLGRVSSPGEAPHLQFPLYPFAWIHDGACSAVELAVVCTPCALCCQHSVQQHASFSHAAAATQLVPLEVEALALKDHLLLGYSNYSRIVAYHGVCRPCQ